MTGKLLRDFQGREVSLTAERREHILEHPEMSNLDAAIVETIINPERVVQSASDTAFTCTIASISERLSAANIFA